MDEDSYICGSRFAWLTMLRTCLRELGYDDPEVDKVKWVSEREAAIHTLRQVCAEFGDNDWSENLNLSDIIEKHLARRLYDASNLT